MAKAPGSAVIIALRLVITYETPLGTRTLSSSTRTSPSGLRIRSTPATWTRTPLAGSMPQTARWKWVEEVISWLGTTPSAITRAPAYTSARKASSAWTRWATPASMVAHSAAAITRGTRSSGNGRSTPPTSKVTPAWV